MDQMRLMAALVLSFLVFFLWNTFFGQEPPPKTAAQPESVTEKMVKAEPVPVVPEQSASAPAVASVDAAPARAAREITIRTPLYTVGLSEQGAVVNRFILHNYRVRVERDAPHLNLFPEDGSVGSLYLGAAGIPGFEDALYQLQGAVDPIQFNEGEREVVFAHRTAKGLLVEKIYRFMADSYVMGFDIRITNTGAESLKEVFSVALREAAAAKKSSYVFEGPSALINGSLETVEVGDIAKNNTLKGAIAWTALQTRYFMTSLIPIKEQEAVLRLSVLPRDIVEARYEEPEVLLSPGSRQSFEHLLFFGPKSTEALSQAGHELIRVIDFGTFHFLAKPLLWLMNWIYGVLPNYGLAIIVLTILTKVLLWPLGNKSYKSMSQMKKLQPLIQEIRQTGARIKLISDGDVAGAIATATEDSGVNILFGIGGSPEAVISAAALKCLGGEIQAKLWPRDEAERKKILDMGYSEADLDRAYGTEDMAQGDSIIFCATGITGGDFLPGVRYEENLAITHSVAMRAKTRTVRYITAHHHLDIKTIPSRTEAREIGI